MEAGKPIEVTDAVFEDEVLKSELPVLVDFWATWCGPCQTVVPILDAIAKDYQGKVKVSKVNIEEGRQTAMKYGVMSVPTLLIFKDGQVVDQINAITSSFKSDIKKKLESYILK